MRLIRRGSREKRELRAKARQLGPLGANSLSCRIPNRKLILIKYILIARLSRKWLQRLWKWAACQKLIFCSALVTHIDLNRARFFIYERKTPPNSFTAVVSRRRVHILCVSEGFWQASSNGPARRTRWDMARMVRISLALARHLHFLQPIYRLSISCAKNYSRNR